MFVAALLTIAKTGKQPKCPSAEERINKMCYIHTMEYFSVIERRKLDACYNMDELEDVTLSEVGPSQKDKHDHVTHMRHPEQLNSQR